MSRIRDWHALDDVGRRRRRDASRAHAIALNAVTNAFVQIEPDAPHGQGALAGLPYAAKDLCRTPRREPCCGLDAAGDFGIDGFYEPIAHLAEAGADLIGYASMTELAYEPSGFNAVCGRVRNPWNFDFVAGGSSSGSAVAVAGGAVVAAIGTDTGGSVRIPAHCCGVTGWKSTYGLVPTRGAMPLAPTLDTIGLLGHGAADLIPLMPFMASVAPGEAPRRAIVPDDVAALCAPAIRRALAQAVAAIEAAGVAIERRPALPAIDAIDAHALTVMFSESARVHRNLIGSGRLARSLQRRLEKGLEIADASLAQSVAARASLVTQFDAQVLAGADVVVLPVMVITTPTAEECDPGSPRFSAKTLYALSRLTRFVNMLGYPAVAMPAGFDDNGLPVAVQIVGRAGSDLALLDLVRRVQSSTDWHARVPNAVAHLLPEAELRP
jgi:aspartyl-tRNA(Asn)/glutamyl-tRNA(Gln) amidotransferase subunit A